MTPLHSGDDVDGVLYVSRQRALRRSPHPVAFTHDLEATPIARTLLGTPLVLWRNAAGRPAAARDRCPHRWARLSAGTVVAGDLQCPYHGWRFGDDGAAVAVPQLEPGGRIPPTACLDTVTAVERYGMVWVALDPEGPVELPKIPEFDDDRFRAIRVGAISYRTSAAVVIDNNTDATHVAFVHARSFGAGQDPLIGTSRVGRTPYGIEVTSERMPVGRTPTAGEPGDRWGRTEIWLPFVQVGRLHYSDGSTHILVKGCCPVDDEHTEVHLTVLRNDVDDPADAAEIVDFELTVEHEDKAVLDTVPGGFPLDPRLQTHTRHDRPGVAYRQALAAHLDGPSS
jgi:phenylpropionate dioxygenase-like ring-hydroxylating dioxygenase large terminal subunit